MSRVTILDVAKKSGVSKSTVSRVLRNDADVSERVRLKVQSTAHRLGYQPSRLAGSLRSNRTFSIGLVIPDIANPFFPDIVRTVQEVADARGYTVLLQNSDWLEQRECRFLELARRYHLDGILINPARIAPADLAAVGCPVVVIGSSKRYAQFDCVGSDTDAGIGAAIEHAAARGHRRIALIPGPRDNPATHTRETAFRAHLKHLGLNGSAPPLVYAQFSREGGAAAAAKLLALRPRPTAVVCGNDLIALGLLAGLSDAGARVPEDVSVMGIDNIDMSSVSRPALTTMGKDKRALGELAATLLIDRIEGKRTGPPVRQLLPTQLIERQSVASPR